MVENIIENIKLLSRIECLKLDLYHAFLKLPEEKRKIIITNLREKRNGKCR